MTKPTTAAGQAAMEFLQTRAWRETILAIEAEAVSTYVWRRLEAQPGFNEELAQGLADVEAGRTTPWSDVSREIERTQEQDASTLRSDAIALMQDNTDHDTGDVSLHRDDAQTIYAVLGETPGSRAMPDNRDSRTSVPPDPRCDCTVIKRPHRLFSHWVPEPPCEFCGWDETSSEIHAEDCGR